MTMERPPERRPLLAERAFAPLFWCQFFAAFNDNFLKNALVFLILWGVGGHQGTQHGGEALVTLAGAVFIAPFFLLSGLAGELADGHDKARVATWLKAAEIPAAILAVTGFLLHSLPVLFLALFCFGTLSALFGPVKYAILPDHLPQTRLGAANALIEAATFVSILLGTVAGGLAARGAPPAVFAVLVTLFAVLSFLFARRIPATGVAVPGLRVRANILASTGSLLRQLWEEKRLWRTALIAAWFWVSGAVGLSLLGPLVKSVLHGNELAVTLSLTVFSISVALGSFLAAALGGGRIALLPSVLGAALQGLAGLDLWRVIAHVPAGTGHDLPLGTFLHQPGVPHVMGDLVLLAVSAGLIAVPSFSALQAWAARSERARVVAAANIVSAGGMVAGGLVVAVLQLMGLGSGVLFGLLGMASLVVAGLALTFLPTNALRDAIWLLFRIVYRVELQGAEHLSHTGPRTVIALNHVSWLDAVLSLALLEQEPVFAIDRSVSEKFWVRPFLRFVRALPIEPAKPFATRTLINAVKAGDPLIIFPEGRITVTGSLMKVYDGAAMIAERSEADVIPVRLSGLEYTPFSRLNRKQAPRRLFPKVRITALAPQRLEVPAGLIGRRRREVAGRALNDVMTDLIWRTTPVDHTLFEAVRQAACLHGWRRVAIEDPVTGPLTYSRLLTGAAVLGRALSVYAGPDEALGVLLPNANATAVTFFALQSARRIPAMLNFTAGAANLLAACRAAQVKTVITSRAFISKAALEPVIEALSASQRIVYLEDVRAGLSKWDKIRGVLTKSRALVPGRNPDAPAAILFTSGSEGTPKGVVISHRNILANSAQTAAVIDFGRQDKVFNVLPVFHSFGLMAGLVLPLSFGVPSYLYPSPLHYRIVPELIYATNATILLGTDTFLMGYARMAHPYDMRALRYVVAGAEPVKAATRHVYEEKFGVRVLEGYGVTETSPVLALNTPMHNRYGTVGRLLPGIVPRLEPVAGVETGGRLWVRGPNVMLGYLRTDAPGVIEPPPGGEHDTGDIVTIGEDGFVTIQGRAKRFAKLGGEMISLAAVEALASDLWPDAMSAATSLPDGRKGERIVMLTTQADASKQVFLAHAKAAGASEMMVPAVIVTVDALPLMGSGKIDHPAVRRQAEILL
ncbi:2-acylglycerophosphoethanolamine acyltransferase [Granulibacter bethesdensis]|uniref:2-acylglycerophosphoethanolamine acyltransferase n=2 Tax=Granulibacter bethesdensis TaxID=364410 RepID=A0AAN0RG70_9PROT|nr:2-acylglycerophosphoethanolamine acyltransferase [Granulibacter bethesdensis]